MRKIFEQSESQGVRSDPIHVFLNANKDIYIGDMDMLFLCFDQDEAILLAQEIIDIANKLKKS